MKGVQPVRYISLDGQTTHNLDGEVVDEAQVCISVNGSEVATIMCSPHDLDKLALGFLYNEGVISGPADVRALHLSRN